MSEIFNNPVEYSNDKQTPGPDFIRRSYRAVCICHPTDKAGIYKHFVWIKSELDFYKLLAYWNAQGGYIWKYVE